MGPNPELVKPLIDRFQKNTTVRVPRNRTVKVIKVKCQDGTCKIRRAVPSVKIGGRSFNSVTVFSRKPFAAGQTRVIKLKIERKRAWQRLRQGAKSGALTVAVTAVSSNKMRSTESFRFGLRR